MAYNPMQGAYTPKNPEKYSGNISKIRYRSGWELKVFQFCDNHPSVVSWASEPIKIPYFNPLTKKQTVYVPDIFMVYQDANGTPHAELVEIKPMKQTTMENAGKSPAARASVVVNQAKWAAARAWCARQNIVFRVITEMDIFRGPKK